MSFKYLHATLSTGLIVLLTACTAVPGFISTQPAAPKSSVETVTCEPDFDLGTHTSLRKLALANEWHSAMRYQSAFEAYEAVLAEHDSLLSDAYALWGIVALRLDRANPGYSREAAQTAIYVLDQRVEQALATEAASEARLLWFSARVMIDADISKDQVMAENIKLIDDLAHREEAIKRLRELTLGN